MFEFDPAKSAANKEKHGIDFVEAQELWGDPNQIELRSSQSHHGEDRRLAIAKLVDRIWTAVIVRRDHKIRIISVRRARDHEELAYEQARKD